MKRLTTLFVAFLFVCSGFGQTVLLGNEQYGSELVINGDFVVSTGWTFNDDWSYDAVNFEADYTDGVQSYFYRSITITAGITYQLSYTIKNYSAGTGYIWFTNQTGTGLFSESWWTITANGVSTVNYVALESATSLRVYAHSLSVNYSVDDISIKAVTKEAGYVLTQDGKVLIAHISPEALHDGNTVAWFAYNENITKDGSDFVSVWGDKSSEGNDLLQAAGTNQPLWSSDGVLFDGVDNFMKCVGFTYDQPEMIYIVIKQVTWTVGEGIFDGNANNKGLLFQQATTPGIIAYAGSASGQNDNLAVNTFGIVRILFNGALSKLQIDETAATIGDFGAINMEGFLLGANGGETVFGNIQVKEIILRKIVDSESDEQAIYDYLKKKYALSMWLILLLIPNVRRKEKEFKMAA